VIVRKLFQYFTLSIILLSYQQVSNATFTTTPTCVSKAIKSDHRTQRDLSSETLPTNLSYSLLLQHIANELDWMPSNDPTMICGGYYVQPAIVTLYPNPGPAEQQPAIITAKGPSTITTNGISILQQNVVVTQPGRIAQADKAYIYRDGKTGHINKIILVGHVKLREAGKLLAADRGTLTLYPKTADLVNVAYHIYSEQPYNRSIRGSFNAWGTATHGYRDENQVITLHTASYTTCSPTKPSWMLRASRIVLDKIHHVGKAYNARVRFKGIPLIYTPYYSFALDHQRKTGFLTPRVGYMTRTGGDFAFPFYWNMAPNYDLTLTPEYLTQRNYEFSGLFRFLSERSLGNTYINYLPNDPQFQIFRNQSISIYSNPLVYDQTFFAPYLNQLKSETNSRAFFSMTDTTNFNPDLVAHININYVTDPYYFEDLGGQMGGNTQSNQLLNRLDLEYSGWHWDFMGMLQAYQTLHLINQTQSPALDQYSRLPDLTLNGYYPYVDHDIDLILNNELVNFSYQSNFNPDKPIGQRLHLRPGLSFPVNFASAYFMPQIWADMTAYNVEHLQPGQTSSADRTLPIADIDTGLYFDRDFLVRGNEYIQTLEPRIFYLFVPFQNQNALPNFDTVLLPFSFEQLFSLNGFTGDDRLQNANQISWALTSRILNAETGASVLTANIGGIYYFALPRVCLSTDCNVPVYQFSPIVGELIYSPGNPWSISSSVAWDPNTQQTNNAAANINYNRNGEGTHIASLGYLFVKGNGASIVPGFISQNNSIYSNNTNQITASIAWPIVKEWSLLGFWDYNITFSRTDTYFGGLQYDTCCWSFRFVTQRSFIGYVTNTNGNIQNSYDSSYYVQLQLKGLGDFGTANTDTLLAGSIPGFPKY
jgi:LPS-assembly protein